MRHDDDAGPAFDASALLDVAASAARANDHQGAFESFEEVLRVDPDNVEARLGSAQALARLQPDDATPLLEVADVLVESGDPAGAEDAYLGAIRAEDKSHYAHGLYGHFLLDVGRPLDAISRLERALELNRLCTDCLNNLGVAHLECGESERSIQIFRELLSGDATYSDGRLGLADALTMAGRLSDARSEYLRVLASDAASTHALVGLGVVSLRGDLIEEARVYYARALEQDPDDVDALRGMGVVHEECRDLEEAEQWYSKAISLERGNCASLLRRSRLRRGLGRTALADQDLEEAAKYNPEDEEVARELKLHQGPGDVGLKGGRGRRPHG